LRRGGSKNLPPRINWNPISRTEAQRKKFSATRQEVLDNVDIASAGAQVSELDDSTFLLLPKR
jgi:hypothetical protein